MKCKNCKYFDKNGEKFENTTLKTCKCAYYLLTQLKIDHKSAEHAYLTTALTSPNDNCKFEKSLLTIDD